MERIAKVNITSIESYCGGPIKIELYCTDKEFEKAMFHLQIKNPRIIWEEQDDYERKELLKKRKELQKQVKEANKGITEIDKKLKEIK